MPSFIAAKASLAGSLTGRREPKCLANIRWGFSASDIKNPHHHPDHHARDYPRVPALAPAAIIASATARIAPTASATTAIAVILVGLHKDQLRLTIRAGERRGIE